MEIMDDNQNVNEKNRSLEIGMLIYQGKKEIHIDAIKQNTWEIIEISSNQSGHFIKLKNLFDATLKSKKISSIFSTNYENNETLIIETDFDSIVNSLSITNILEYPYPESAIPKQLINKADQIIAKLKQVEDEVARLRIIDEQDTTKSNGKTKNINTLVTEACANLNKRDPFNFKLHRSSYFKRKKEYEICKKDRLAYAASLHRKTFNKTRIDKTTQNFIDSMILNYIAGDAPRYSVSTVYNKIIKEILIRTDNYWVDPEKCAQRVPNSLIAEIINVNIPIENIFSNKEKFELLSKVNLPSRSWFNNYVRRFISNPELSEKQINKRYGAGFYENSIMVFDTFVSNAKYPLHYVFADFCLLDIFIVDEETRSEPYKVWLTVLIDAYSRCILGIALYKDRPKIESIQMALKHAIWPKDDWLKKNKINTDLPWDCYGIPVNLSLDNEWANHSISLENLASKIESNQKFTKSIITFRPPYKARYGALVERFFGNLQNQMAEHLVGAYRGRNFKSIHDAKNKACLLFSDLLQSVTKIIINYMHEPHSELFGKTPIEKWREGIENHLPIIPQYTKETERYFWRSWHHTRVISKDGIHLFGMRYTSPNLTKAQVVDWNGKRIECGISFDVEDISTLAVFQQNKWICDVKSKDLQVSSNEWLHLSLTEFELAKKMAKETSNTSTEWIEFAFELNNLNRKRQQEKKTAKRRATSRKNSFDKSLSKEYPEKKDQITSIVSDFLRTSIGDD